MSTTVAMVATFAAIISYTHIYSLARHHNQPVIDAALTPLITDGLIVASSLVLVYVAWQKLDVPWLARVTLWLGIAATVAANVAYGLSYGVLGAILSSWPALAFVLTVETVMQLAKTKKIKASTKQPEIYPDVARLRRLMQGSTTTINAERERLGYAEPPPPKDGQVASVIGKPVRVMKIRDIREQLKCGQPKATDLQRIMKDTNCELDVALKIREERMQRHG